MTNEIKKTNKILEFLKKNNAINLSIYFVLITTFLTVAVILLMSWYVVKHVSNISEEYNANLQTYNYSFLTLFSNEFETNYKNNNLKASNTLVTNLKNRNVVSYAYAINAKTHKVFWSTIPSIMNKAGIEAQGEIYFEFQNTEIEELVSTTKDYALVVGLSQEKVSPAHLSTLIQNIKYVAALFLLISLFASLIMSRIILKPILKLTQGVKEFAKGNFDFRLEESDFSEINELIDAYNYMAFQLHELYESLELKVQERTIALQCANREIKEAQSMMVHSEKMRSLGELVAGIAHEINNPINFIYGNIMILEKYVKDLFTLINLYIENENNIPEEQLQKINAFKTQMDLDFIKDDVNDLLRSCKEGTERTKNIVLDLKNFSRMEEMVLTQMNVAKEIDTTLNILNNKYKNRITVHKDYDNVPKIEAYGGQLNQVFMNILDNAQYAIEGNGDVYISVKQDGDFVEIKFQDTGKGIKQEDLKKVFEPFFTTKPVGEGTGLGMSISYRVIKNHHGEIFVDSKLGEGTTFTIKLPINYTPDKNKNEVEEETV